MAQDLLQQTTLWSEIRLLFALGSLFILPGAALLSLTQGFAGWRGFERSMMAIGLSISLYPVLFYASRLLAPMLTLGPLLIGGLLGGCAILLVTSQKRHRGSWLPVTFFEWTVFALILLAIVSRLWVAHTHPFPAWTDSLHHAMITELTVQNGYLPKTLAPYFDIPLTVYHLGLYSIAASASWLAQVPAHLALQWSAQLLNGCAGLGVFLILVRISGSTGAIVGLIYVGFLSHQPAYYVNWGRFTQIASQVVMPIAWIATVDTIQQWTSQEQSTRWLYWRAFCCGLLTAALFLFHFRVALFYVLLLSVTLVWLSWQAITTQKSWRMIKASIAIGLCSFFFILPGIWEILYNYYVTFFLPTQFTFPELFDQELTNQFVDNYYNFSLDMIPVLAARPIWLGLTLVLAVAGVILRNWLTILNLIWISLLYGLASAYILGIQGLSVTNMGAVLIMLYLPFSIIIGSATQEIVRRIPRHPTPVVQKALLVALFFAVIPFAWQRAEDLEPARFFVSPSDIEAMGWIQTNVPEAVRFAVKTTFWLPLGPHGIDGGYWIPYFTGHQTTAGTMLTAVSLNEHHRDTVILSRIVKELETNPYALTQLSEKDVDYIYLGSSGFQPLSSLNAESLLETSLVEVVFQNEGVTILHIINESSP